jgi:hypothetical protein
MALASQQIVTLDGSNYTVWRMVCHRGRRENKFSSGITVLKNPKIWDGNVVSSSNVLHVSQ